MVGNHGTLLYFKSLEVILGVYMNYSHYGVVEIKDISSEIVDELTSIAIQEFGCSGSQNQEIDIDKSSNIDKVPDEILTMSGEFTQEQSNFVDEHFFSDIQSAVYFFFEGDNEGINLNAKKFIQFVNEELDLNANLSLHENVDWRDSYKEFFTHAKIDDNLIVLPDWNQHNPEFSTFEKKLFLIPGMGFGTGGHETTRLCLKFLNKISPKKRILDLGCGSGILGNFCELYLGSYVDYVDVDQDALDNCMDNRKLNNLAANGAVKLRSEYQTGEKYDIVIANILKPVLEMESDLIYNSLNLNGEIIFSGLLKNQYEELLGFYRDKYLCDFKYEILNENDWVAIRVFDIMR